LSQFSLHLEGHIPPAAKQFAEKVECRPQPLKGRLIFKELRYRQSDTLIRFRLDGAGVMAYILFSSAHWTRMLLLCKRGFT